MAIRIDIAETGEEQSEYSRSFLQSRIAIGRARSSDICLPDMAVSTRHAEIRLKGNDYAVVDLGSVNGTQVQGVDLVPHRPRVLRNGDAIEIAGFALRFCLGALGAETGRDIAARHAKEILSKILARTGTNGQPPVVEVVSGPGRAGRFELLSGGEGAFIIGRSQEADIRLDDGDVSRHHAEIVLKPEGVFVRDLGSRNGLFAGGSRHEALRINPGDRFQVGQTILVLEHPAESSLNAIFEAPEEATSSFAIAEKAAGDELRESVGRAEGAQPETDDIPTQETPRPPVGPKDPLVGIPEEKVRSRTTGHIPVPTQIPPNSDLGLIIIGGLIVAGSVLGLVYFFAG